MPSISASSAASFESRSGAKPPSSPTAVASPRSWSVRLSAWKTSAPVRSPSANEPAPHRHHHELLEVDLVVRVGAAVQHVHHRHRQHVRGLAAEVAPERLPGLGRRGLRPGQGDAEDRVRAEPALVRGAVELDHRAVERRLVGWVEPAHRLGQLAVHVGHRLRDPLARPGVAAVAQLHRLELAGRGAGGHRGAAGGARLQQHVDLDCRVAAAVEDLPRVHLLDLAQPASTWSRNRSAALRSASSGSTPASTAPFTAASSAARVVVIGPIPAEAGVRRLAEHLLGVERGREGVGNRAEDRAVALLLALDLVPVGHHLFGTVGHPIAEDVRMAADQLLAAVVGHLRERRPAPRSSISSARK